jgi:hypothetical protein
VDDGWNCLRFDSEQNSEETGKIEVDFVIRWFGTILELLCIFETDRMRGKMVGFLIYIIMTIGYLSSGQF